MPTYHLTYLWFDSQHRIRSKVKITDIIPTGIDSDEDTCLDIKDVPEWNFDGSSCGIATTKNSEVCLKPVAKILDPFYLDSKKTYFCEEKDYYTLSFSYLIICDNYIYNEAGKVMKGPKYFKPDLSKFVS